MALVENLTVTVNRDVANADITVEYDIVWDSFDQSTNVPWEETWRLIGDDTGQDGDDGTPGDDNIPLGLMFVSTVSSNGDASTHRVKSKTIAWATLNEDKLLPPADDDELRAVVTLTPKLPVAASKESGLVVLNV